VFYCRLIVGSTFRSDLPSLSSILRGGPIPSTTVRHLPLQLSTFHYIKPPVLHPSILLLINAFSHNHPIFFFKFLNKRLFISNVDGCVSISVVLSEFNDLLSNVVITEFAEKIENLSDIFAFFYFLPIRLWLLNAFTHMSNLKISSKGTYIRNIRSLTPKRSL